MPAKAAVSDVGADSAGVTAGLAAFLSGGPVLCSTLGVLPLDWRLASNNLMVTNVTNAAAMAVQVLSTYGMIENGLLTAIENTTT